MSLKRRNESLTFSEVFRKVIILVKRRIRIIFNIDIIFNSSIVMYEFATSEIVDVDDVAL